MIKYIAILLFLIVLSLGASAQVLVVSGKDTARFTSDDDYYTHHNSRDGYWIYMASDTTRGEEGNYVADKREGVWISYYPNGNKNREMEYVHGKVQGRAKIYYEEGGLQEEGLWIDRHWSGEYRFYHKNGNPSYIWQYNESGKRTGVQQYFHENGMIMIEGEWNEGKEQGTIKEYYDNGALKTEKNYSNGVCDGSQTKEYQNTQPTQPTEVALGKFTGNGFFKTLNNLRKVEFEGIWKNGKFVDGKRYIYSNDGKLLKTQIYRNGNKISEAIVK